MLKVSQKTQFHSGLNQLNVFITTILQILENSTETKPLFSSPPTDIFKKFNKTRATCKVYYLQLCSLQSHLKV